MAESLGSRYVLQEVLGRGAMGQVFSGSVRSTGEQVAVKVLRPELVSDREVVARFVQERTILMSIADPNVVRVIDLVVEGDTLAIVMELVQGSDLRRQLRTRRTLAPAEALHLTGQLLRGVAAVHAAGIVHRDIKPENVLVDTSSRRPRLKLTDFGVARLSYGASLTKLSGLLGTPEYMAPELVEGNRATPHRPMSTRRASFSTRCYAGARRSRAATRSRCCGARSIRLRPSSPACHPSCGTRSPGCWPRTRVPVLPRRRRRARRWPCWSGPSPRGRPWPRGRGRKRERRDPMPGREP